MHHQYSSRSNYTTTTMDPESHTSTIQHNRIKLWLASRHGDILPLTPPPDDDPRLRQAPLKRKRAMSLPANVPASSSQRSDSPKRRRTDDMDDVQPEQSVSQLGSEAALALNRTNTFSPPASRVSSGSKRPSSPTRETPIMLRSALPPVWTESLNGLKEAPPEPVDRLGDWLAEGVDFGFIPQGLQVRGFELMRSHQSNMCLARHQERPRGGPPNHETRRLRPQRHALCRGDVGRMGRSQEDISQCARLQGWQPG